MRSRAGADAFFSGPDLQDCLQVVIGENDPIKNVPNVKNAFHHVGTLCFQGTFNFDGMKNGPLLSAIKLLN